MNDLTLLKAALEKDNYDLIIKYLDLSTVAFETKELLRAIGNLFKTSDIKRIPLPNFSSIVHKALDTKPEVLNVLIENVINTPDVLVKDLVFDYAKKEFLYKMTEKSNNVNDIVKNFERFKSVCTDLDPTDEELTPEEVFKSVNEPGLNWRLTILQRALGPIRKGDFGIVGAFVDTGKTSFICSEITHFARQIKDGRPILYLNNEGLETKIYRRLWTTALNRSAREIYNNLEAAKVAYNKALNGNTIKVINIMRYTPTELEALIDRYNPALVVIDQLDNVRGFEKQSNASHERYGYLYQWAREMAAMYCPIIAVSQCDASTMAGRVGEEPRGQAKIAMHQLRGAKVDKQAAADYIITIGTDLQSENVRYINVPKNKLEGNKLYSPVNFNTVTGRYYDA